MSGNGPETTDDLLVGLVRIARGLEEQLGSYAGRIWWAALDARLREQSLLQGIPKDPQTLAGHMVSALDALRRSGMDPDLLSALQRTLELVDGGQMVTWDEFGHVLVCRHCGAASFGGRETSCPDCGAHWLTRRELRPIWFLETLDPEAVHEALSSMPDQIAEKLQGLTESELGRRPLEGEWSSREVVEHLWLAQGIMQDRIVRMLEEENPRFEGVAIRTEAREDWTTADLMRDFKDSRESILERVSGLDHTQWLRPGWHEEFGRITALSQASYMVRHEGYHLRQLDQVRRALEG